VFESHYTAGCSGHDEPELDPVSAVPGSAKDITWTVVLPSNGSFFPVDAVGPTFWFGGAVNDPNSLFGQAFEELQFYPNALVSNCTPNGGFVVSNVPGDYTVCSPVWTITTTGQKPNYHEPAAFNAMLTNGSSNTPCTTRRPHSCGRSATRRRSPAPAAISAGRVKRLSISSGRNRR